MSYSNRQKVYSIANSVWEEAKSLGLQVNVDYSDEIPYMRQSNGREIVNMVSCSYLGLDRHPDILNGAIDGIKQVGAMHLTTPRYRMSVNLLDEVENALSEHFQGIAICYISCSMASSTFLPLYASGILSNNQKPIMIFDKHAHFSINHIKPICADETQILTCEHNDINYIENVCKNNANVIYVGEGVYSMNGVCPIDDLLKLQDKYGLFLYFDDSHGVSIIGDRGQGFILNRTGYLNERTVVVASLAKAFGACGGVLLTGNQMFKEIMIRYGSSWSQYLNSAGLGSVLASIKIHKSSELKIRQDRWKANLQYIDENIPIITNSKILAPTRMLRTKSVEEALMCSKSLLDFGYFVSPVFFPVVPKDSPGIRFMPRADMNISLIEDFCTKLKSTFL